MTYRNDGGGAAAASRIDPLARFLALDAAFDAERGWLGDRVPLRLAAAALITTQGEPDVLAAKVRECDAALAKLLYDRLKAAPKIWAGDPLQTAANVLALIPVAPESAATRFLAVASALRDAGVKVRQAEYDDVALLSFVPQPPEVIARMVEEYRVTLDRALPGASSLVATGLAASLTFVRIVLDGGVSPLADAKLLMEMQGVVAMRQASVLVAGGG